MARTSGRRVSRRAWMLVAAALVAATATLAAQDPRSTGQNKDSDGFRFKTGVELINVTATVTDSTGRFVPGLGREDFVIYEDGVRQQITHFSNERVPVSLGIAIDTSGSMAGEKWDSARNALDRFLLDLLGIEDEIFLYRFSTDAVLVQDWTSDRERLSRMMGRIRPNGGTAMYDAIGEAVPMAASGTHRKKALLVISDGNDTGSSLDVPELKQMIRESEVLVYAVGIDGASTSTGTFGRPPMAPPIPFPIPGGRRRTWPPTGGGPWGGGPGGGGTIIRNSDRVNAMALREITDDSGGRTEIVRTARDLDPATANIADELSKQYYLAYPAGSKKDGQWHTIRVEVSDSRYRVRARRGYVAS
jgi:VWFA-related protein